MKINKLSFNEKIMALKKAIEIGEEVITISEQISTKEKDECLYAHKFHREQLGGLTGKFANLTSLAYNEDNFLVYWNEAIGVHVDLFWEKLKVADLPYKRKRNVLTDTLAKGRIRNIHEYHTLVDGLVIYYQNGMIDEKQMQQLSEMLDRFASKYNKKMGR
jgi:hypothetical protein